MASNVEILILFKNNENKRKKQIIWALLSKKTIKYILWSPLWDILSSFSSNKSWQRCHSIGPVLCLEATHWTTTRPSVKPNYYRIFLWFFLTFDKRVMKITSICGIQITGILTKFWLNCKSGKTLNFIGVSGAQTRWRISAEYYSC